MLLINSWTYAIYKDNNILNLKSLSSSLVKHSNIYILLHVAFR